MTSRTPSLFGTTSASATGAITSITSMVATSSSSSPAPSSTSNNSGGGGPLGSGPNTGLAMIILYAITGCVTLLFLIVILSGAIRAMRHPDRYGPRARNLGTGENGQSRAGGLTKAILDTFPVVKFLSGQSGAEGTQRQSQAGAAKDEESGSVHHVEHQGENVPMQALSKPGDAQAKDVPQGHATEASEAATLAVPSAQHDREDTSATVTNDTAEDGSKAAAHTHTAPLDAQTNPQDVNDSITCPICLLDFEDGDDIRILPCDGRHRFHDECVVPWLLNQSSLCPLCRLDLAQDRTAASSTEEPPSPSNARPASSSLLASHFRSLLPGRAARAQGALAQTDEVPSTSQAILGGAEHAEASTSTPAGEDAAGSRSKFMRYVRDRRSRVAAGTSGQAQAPTRAPFPLPAPTNGRPPRAAFLATY